MLVLKPTSRHQHPVARAGVYSWFQGRHDCEPTSKHSSCACIQHATRYQQYCSCWSLHIHAYSETNVHRIASWHCSCRAIQIQQYRGCYVASKSCSLWSQCQHINALKGSCHATCVRQCRCCCATCSDVNPASTRERFEELVSCFCAAGMSHASCMHECCCC